MHKSIWLLGLFLFCGCGGSPTDVGINSLLGRWEVDFDRTVEAYKQSPEYDEKMAERMPDMIKRMVESMSIELTESEMIYHRGGTAIPLPYTVVAADGNTVTISATSEEGDATVNFTLLDGDYLQFTSSASDDIDYFVWRRGGPPALSVSEF